MKTSIPPPDAYQDMREALRDLCGRFDSAYWQKVDAERGYPEAFVEALTQAGWLAAMVPADYGGSGLGLAEASVVMEEINFSGGNAGACHGQMYNMGTLLRHGSSAQKQRYLPGIAAGKLRPRSRCVNHETNEVFFDNLEVPVENLIGDEGMGFRYILDGLNAERTLIAAECIGDACWFVDKARRYASERVVFDRPIGKNQGVQFPIASAYIETEAANLMRFKACALFDAGKPCGGETNMAKYLAGKASWEAANVCPQTHGGFGFAHEYDVERKFRETRLYQVAPISTDLIYSYVAEHLLGLPRSF
ncbi:MAG: acyl-CoA/acyl-ACP dehydrogenase [Burkholderiales bacterium]|nr:acyl-CoA/acyl-ACP dehydrogenase [Burkholderiales bacterium]